MSIYIQGFVFTELFLEMQCDRNEDGTWNLILRGNDLIKKVGKRVNDSDLVTIVDFLRRHPQVISLNLPYNEITDCGMSTLTDFLKEGPVIRHLNLIGNRIGHVGIKYLIEVGESLPVYGLRLSGNKLGIEGGKKVAELLWADANRVLRFLDLSDTDQTAASLAYLMTALMPNRGGTNVLEYVDLGRPLPQEYHQMNDSHAAEALGQVLKDNRSLKELHVQQFGLDFRDVEILLVGLLANTTLLCLDLNNNRIGDDGVDFLCSYLRTSPQLECLMIGTNNFGDLGAASLSFSLPFSKIKLLDITNNRITDSGMTAIFHTIKKTVTLEALFCWGNEMKHESLLVLQRMFKTGALNPERTDVAIYCASNELHAALNPRANRYTHRFYCVSDYGHPPLRKITKIFYPPKTEPPFTYKYHVNDTEVGFPVCEWQTDTIDSNPEPD